MQCYQQFPVAIEHACMCGTENFKIFVVSREQWPSDNNLAMHGCYHTIQFVPPEADTLATLQYNYTLCS